MGSRELNQEVFTVVQARDMIVGYIYHRGSDRRNKKWSDCWMYDSPLNNMSLNYTGTHICGFFSTNTV